MLKVGLVYTLQVLNIDPWANPTRRSTSGLYDLHHRSIGLQNWGLYFLDSPGRLGSVVHVWILGRKS